MRIVERLVWGLIGALVVLAAIGLTTGSDSEDVTDVSSGQAPSAEAAAVPPAPPPAAEPAAPVDHETVPQASEPAASRFHPATQAGMEKYGWSGPLASTLDTHIRQMFGLGQQAGYMMGMGADPHGSCTEAAAQMTAGTEGSEGARIPGWIEIVNEQFVQGCEYGYKHGL